MVFRLPPQERHIVEEARRQGLLGSAAPPAYLSPGLCVVLSLLLVVPTLGCSLLLMPMLWVAQHDHTARRLERLRQRVGPIPG